jgi:hypothetical protein
MVSTLSGKTRRGMRQRVVWEGVIPLAFDGKGQLLYALENSPGFTKPDRGRPGWMKGGGVNIEEFYCALNEGENPTPLLKAFRDLRSCDLDQLRTPDSLFHNWLVWTEEDTGLAQPPKIYARKPELRS